MDKQVEKLKELEVELIEMIAATENETLMDKFIEWQNQREICNKGFFEFINNLGDEGKNSETD